MICEILDSIHPKNESYMHLIENVQDRDYDFRYSINYDKIKKELDWEPKISFEIGIKIL